MFFSQMVRLKIAEPSSGPPFPCLTRKWYALKLPNPQVAHFFHVSLANGTPQKLPNPQVAHFLNVSLANGMLKIVEPLSGPLFPCFPRKWYALKLSNPQVAHLFHVSLANGTP